MNLKTPKHPIKGKGYARQGFAFDRRVKADTVKAMFFDALPDDHKCYVTTRRRGGFFAGAACVSPEAFALWKLGTGAI